MKLLQSASLAHIMRGLSLIVVGLALISPSIWAQGTGINTHHANLNKAQSQYFSAPDSPSLSITGDLTLEAWINLSSLPAPLKAADLFSKWAFSGGDRSFLFKLVNDNGVYKLFAWVSNTGNDVGFWTINWNTPVVVGQWQHVAIVYRTSGIIELFINGVSQGTVSSGVTSLYDGTRPFLIGFDSYAPNNDYLDGLIDEARIWNMARSQDQIRSTMFTELIGNEPGLRGYWKLNNSLNDSSVNGNGLSNPNNALYAPDDLPFIATVAQIPACVDSFVKGLWHFDGDTNDASGNLTSTTATVITTGDAFGKFFGGANFNGSSSVLNTNQTLIQPGASFSISTWLKGTGWFCDQVQVQAQRYGLHCLYNQNEIGFRFYQDDLNVTVTNNPSEWSHIVLTYDGVTRARKIYKNGILLASDIAGGDLTAAAPFRIGVASGNYFTGFMDDFALYSRALKAEEIMKYYGGIASARFLADASDVVLRREGTTWSEVRNGSFADTIETATSQSIATEVTGGVYSIRSPFLPFDTSHLPASGIQFNQASLNIYLENDSAGSDSISVVQTAQTTWNSITTADFAQRGVVEGSARRANKTNSAYNTWSLNAAGRSFIAQSGQTKPLSASATGKTQLGLRWAKDIDNNAPIARDYASITTASAAINRPYLLVEYAADLTTASISGSIQGAGIPPGLIRVLAIEGTTSTSTPLSALGSYALTGLPKNASYQVTAYVDTNDNQVQDTLEWTGNYVANPLLLDGSKTGINITLAPPVDSDGDGMPDSWETANSLTVGLKDAALDKDGDGLSNIQELWLGLGANDTDSDDDTLSDFIEVNQWGTNPLLTDSDQDGLPDRWETDHGLDPRRNDADEDHDFDFVSNRDEYNGGINSTNPGSGFSGTDGLGDYVRRQSGPSTWLALYDRNDRLLGVRNARGTSFAYRYDGNGNLTHQAKLGLDSDGDGLSDLWEFAHQLDPHSANGVDGASGDADGDGWTNLQEQIGQSGPLVAAEKPGANGIVVASQTAGFVPTHFMSATGQLDNAGAEEIVVGADGNPSAVINAISVYSAVGGAYTRDGQPVDVGAYGVTSLAVGQLGTRPPAVYVGLRKPGGNGRVIELQKTGTTWQTTVIVESVSEAAYVTGIRNTISGNDLIITLAPRFGPDGTLYRAVYEEDRWKVSLLDNSISHPTATTPLNSATRGLGLIAKAVSASTSDRVVRLLDTNSLQTADPKTYRSVDEFDDGTLSTAWTKGGTASGGSSSWSVNETGGILQTRGGTDFGIGYSASAWSETTLQPLLDGEALLISIPYIGHGDNRSGGGCLVRLGNVTLFSTGAGQNASSVTIHFFRMGNLIYFRTKKGIDPWSNWNSGDVSNVLRFEVAVTKSGAGPGQEARVDCDYIRYIALGQLINSGASTADFANSDAAYRVTNNTWYFKTPTSQSWLTAQLYAFARGGSLATTASSDLNTWLHGKFPGEFWTGYYRDFAATPWKWVGNSIATFSPQPWASGQPGTGADQLFAFANNGTWSSATGAELKPAVFEVGAPLVEVSTTVEAEPATSHRLQWAGQTLATGRFNSATPTQTSVVEALIDDKDASGTVTAGDEFVIAELVLDGSPAQTRTLARLPLTAGILAPSYALASVRSRAGTSDFLVTGENDGQVSAWLPPAGGGVLERKTLSVDHLGKSWHGMARVAMGGGTDGLVGLRVTPGSPQTADLIFWSPSELGFAAPPVIQQSLPSARIAPTPATGGTQSRVDVTLWDSEGNASRINLQYQSPPLTGNWMDATLLTVDDAPATGQTALTAPATGATHIALWNATHDLASTTFKAPVLLRARATDFSGTGAWSAPMYYLVDMTADSDGDGMPDAWETANGLNPAAADATGDLDGDGRQNLMEFALGTDPRLTSLVGAPVVFIGNAVGSIAGPSETGYLTIRIPRNTAAAALLFTVEVSGDLTMWATGPDAITVLEDSPSLLTARDNVPASSSLRRFIRLRVSNGP